MKRLALTLIMSFVTLCCYAQSGRMIYGCVYDRHLTPINGAKISTISGELICMTDENGQFNTQTSSYVEHIVISHEGFQTYTMYVDGSYMTIKLQPSLRDEMEKYSGDDAKLKKKYNSILNPKWGIGLRVGGLSCLNLVGYYNVTQRGYAEARFGLSCSPYTEISITADFTALYNWRIVNAEWTPYLGSWFFDAGLGINAGGNGYGAYVGAALMVRLGVNFYKVPMTLSFDYTPSIGLVKYDNYYGDDYYFYQKHFNYFGLINFGITCTYNF